MNIWDVCFPEDIEFGKWFFRNVWKPEYTLLCFEGDVPAAMLTMLPVTLAFKKGDCKVTYIYGAATLPEYRRRGFMDALLTASFAEDEKNGRPVSVLIPQEEWLFGFYRRFGYEPVFQVERREMKRGESSGDLLIRPFREEDADNFSALYETRMKERTHIRRNPDDAWMICRYFSETGSLALVCESEGRMKAAAFGFVRDETLVLQELFAENSGNISEIVSEMCGFCGTDRAKVILPTGEGKEIPFACARVAPKAAEELQWENAYLNLLFN